MLQSPLRGTILTALLAALFFAQGCSQFRNPFHDGIWNSTADKDSDDEGAGSATRESLIGQRPNSSGSDRVRIRSSFARD